MADTAPPSPVERSARLALWVVRWTPLVPAERLDPVLSAHLEHVVALERRGAVFASGPLTDPDGRFSGEGLTVLRVATEEEARAAADADPFVTAGLRSYVLHRWTVVEGALGVVLRFSDSSFTVERS